MGKRVIIAVLLLVAAAVAYGWRHSSGAAAGQTQASLIPLLAGADTAGFSRATEPGAIAFPRDLGAHDDFQTEWWYYTGNLAAADGRQFGFQLTFFRRALTPPDQGAKAPAAEATSVWRTNQVYLAHFTITDVEGGAFYPTERFSRGAAGLAGAQAEPYKVWLEEWSAEEQSDGRVRLVARSDHVALELLLTETLPPILHGDGGLSPKGPEPGNASYYYSIIQQRGEGTVTVDGVGYPVTGVAWSDHEYSTSALGADAVGWDWFSVQLRDGSGLMLFQIRRQDGQIDPVSGGTFIFPDGLTRTLGSGDWQLEVLDHWTSPRSGAEYPAGWRITIPDLGLDLTGRPLLADQELNVSTTYWEGASDFEGQRAGQPIAGQGYVELTGYAGDFNGGF
jgi:predicted secreted hydrolase